MAFICKHSAAAAMAGGAALAGAGAVNAVHHNTTGDTERGISEGDLLLPTCVTPSHLERRSAATFGVD
jgi:hypothetical protein